MRKLDLGQALATAFAHLDADRPAEARRLARDLERAQPALPGLAYLHGLLALAEGDGRKAAQHLKRALAQTPDAPPPLLAMARAQRLQERRAPAVAAYRRLIALSPTMAEAYDELASLTLADAESEAAARLWGRAVALRPEAALFWGRLGTVERSLGRWEAAALSFARAIDIDDSQAAAFANLAGVLRRLKRGAESVALARRAVALEPAVASHWMELGLAERDNAGLAAAAAFHEAAQLDREGGDALWLEGECLAALDRREAALDCYRRLLERDPEDRFGASLAIARLGAAPAPAAAPMAFVRALFDQYADGFDHDLVDGLHYKGPAILAAAIRRALGDGPFDVLDAGCGTGLMGVALRPLAARLDGVDLSPRMVEKASARGLYDRLDAQDLVAVLRSRPAAYDLVAAADVLIYLGDLTEAFQAAAVSLRPHGALAFTVEADAGDGYVLQESRRYAHGRDYLRRTAAAAGFSPLLLEVTSTRDDRGQPVPGFVVVLRK